MRAVSVATVWSIALASSVVSLGCFEIEERPPDAGVTGSSLNGRILVVGTESAQSGAIAHRLQRTRNAVAQLAGGATVRAEELEAALPDDDTGAEQLDVKRRPLPEAKPIERLPLEWRAGEAIVLFDKGRYQDKAAVQRALDEVKARAARLSPVVREATLRVTSCTARWFCLVTLTHEGEKPLSLDDTTRAAKALQAARGDELRVVSRNFLKSALRFPNDPYYPSQWHYDFARLPAAWDITTGADDLVVAVVDGGLRLQHPDIIGRVVQGADLIGSEEIAGDGNGRDPDPNDPGDEALGQNQSSWHGTHVTGTIAASTDNGQGVSGVLWKGKVQPVRVLGMGAQGTDFDILSGVMWAVADPEVEGVPSNTTPAKVINMSLGGPADAEGTQTWAEILNTITDTQKEQYGRPIFIAAAGNSNEMVDTIVPANIPGVITVGATRYDGRRAEYSNWGAAVDVMAPGGQVNVDQNVDGQPDGILSLFDNDYNFEQGTSMAAPHVSGIVGLLVSIKPDLDQAEAQTILRNTANPAGLCNEGCGTGHVDAAAALLAAGGVVQEEPLLAVDVTRIIYQPTITQMPVVVLNLGNAELTWTTEVVGAQAALYSVSPASGTLAAVSASEVTVSLSRGAFETGSANLQFIGTGAAVNQVVRVELYFNDQAVPVQTDLASVEVLAYRVNEAEELELAYDTKALRQQNFVWRMDGVLPGTYYVFAVGDDNNDGIFDPQRESFGTWPLTSNPEPIEVGEAQNFTGIEFGLSGGFRIDGEGAAGGPCTDALDCTFAGDAECLDAWPGGYCTRTCDDGFCGAGASCEILECGAGVPCNVCLSACVSEGQCRADEGYLCDPFGTCTPEGF